MEEEPKKNPRLVAEALAAVAINPQMNLYRTSVEEEPPEGILTFSDVYTFMRSRGHQMPPAYMNYLKRINAQFTFSDDKKLLTEHDKVLYDASKTPIGIPKTQMSNAVAYERRELGRLQEFARFAIDPAALEEFLNSDREAAKKLVEAAAFFEISEGLLALLRDRLVEDESA